MHDSLPSNASPQAQDQLGGWLAQVAGTGYSRYADLRGAQRLRWHCHAEVLSASCSKATIILRKVLTRESYDKVWSEYLPFDSMYLSLHLFSIHEPFKRDSPYPKSWIMSSRLSNSPRLAVCRNCSTVAATFAAASLLEEGSIMRMRNK